MKYTFTILILSLLTYTAYSQCTGSTSTGTTNSCFLNVSNTSTLGNVSSGTWNGTIIGISKGGTGQSTAPGALNAFLPSQSGNSGKFLITDGATSSWGIVDSTKYASVYSLTSYYNKTNSDARYLQSFTESDPTVSSSIKAITGTNISNWNTSFGWGDHAGLYPLLTGSYSNPSWITSLAYSKLSGAPSLSTVATTGNYNDLTSTPTIPTNTNQLTNGAGFVTANNVYSAGFGVSKTGTEPSATFSINQTDIMTVSRASDSISSINTKVNGKVPSIRTLTVNGVAQDLSADRTWTLTTANISEVTNQYFTNARARSAISLTTTGTSGASTYNSTTGVINIPNYTSSTGTVTSVGVTSTDFSVSGSPVTSSGNITANLNTSGITAGTYRGAITFNNKGIATTAINQSYSTPSRALNSNFTISITQPARVTYTVRIAFNITALLSSVGVAALQYSTDGGSNWIPVSTASNSMNLGVILSGYNDFNLSGEIPANALARITTTGTNAQATVTIRTEQQEVLY